VAKVGMSNPDRTISLEGCSAKLKIIIISSLIPFKLMWVRQIK